jgi:hypothetical protein
MMRRTILVTLAAASMAAAISPAAARDGCGAGFHRGPYGHCRPNRGPGAVVVAPGAPVIGIYYPRRGYWDGHRYWWHRERWHGGWRYR